MASGARTFFEGFLGFVTPFRVTGRLLLEQELRSCDVDPSILPRACIDEFVNMIVEHSKELASRLDGYWKSEAVEAVEMTAPVIAAVMQGHLNADHEFFDTTAILDVLRKHGALKNDVPKPKLPISGSEALAKGGTTPGSAIRIHAANSIEGIPKEYAVLKAMFGTPNQDWKLIERSLLDTNDGRRLEKFIISAAGSRREIYFDITEWIKGNTSKEAKAALEAIIEPREKPLTIQLPKEEFMTLQVGLLRLSEAQLSQLGLSEADRKGMLYPLLDALKPWHGTEYSSIPEHISVVALIPVWTKIMTLLMSWQPTDLLQEEELENLKAIIGGTMKAAQTASRGF
jgi:hypothetical protein